MSELAELTGNPTDAAWPAMAMDDAEALLCAAGAPFEVETVIIGGLPTRTWKNAIPTLAALVEAGRAHGERTFVV